MRCPAGGGKGGSDRAAFLKLYNGGYAAFDRIGRDIPGVSNWSACFIGGIQPEPIRRVAREMEDDGLLQRFMFIVPDRRGAGQDRKADWKASNGYEALIRALGGLDGPYSGPHGQPLHVTLAEGAQHYREEMDRLAAREMANPDVSNRMKATFGKWGGLFARLCLTFHMIDETSRLLPLADLIGSISPGIVVSEDTAARVAALMRDILLPHLRRAEAIMFGSARTGHAEWIAKHILANGRKEISARDVQRAYGALSAPEKKNDLHAVMDWLTAYEWLRGARRLWKQSKPMANAANRTALPERRDGRARWGKRHDDCSEETGTDGNGAGRTCRQGNARPGKPAGGTSDPRRAVRGRSDQ